MDFWTVCWWGGNTIYSLYIMTVGGNSFLLDTIACVYDLSNAEPAFLLSCRFLVEYDCLGKRSACEWSVLIALCLFSSSFVRVQT